MSEMAPQIAKAIFVGNIKGGVGKSTLSVYLTEYLRRRFKRQSVTLIDTDPQGTSFELMEPKSKSGDVRFLPVGDRYDGVNMSTLDGVLRRLLAQNENMAVVDTGAGYSNVERYYNTVFTGEQPRPCGRPVEALGD